MSKSNFLKLLVLGTILGGAMFLALRQRAPRPVSIGDAAPDFTLPALASGNVSLRAYRHRVVVVNFWATWCPPCVQETPSLERFAQQMEKRGVAVLGVSVDEDPAALEKFVAGYHLSYPILRDPDRSTAARYGTFKFPETYILDRDGKVAEKIVGATDWSDPRVIALVQELVQPGSSPGP